MKKGEVEDLIHPDFETAKTKFFEAREAYQTFFKENPTAVGLSVPGMVQGSPGMEGPNPMPYDSLLVLSNGKSQIS